ncbi:hypothetical protein A2U01_0078936, partial [Trifolium medium]|nr:hypothetical protein [Trifolium medium]
NHNADCAVEEDLTSLKWGDALCESAGL